MNHGLIQIGSEKPTTIRESAELIVEISEKPIKIQYDLSKPEGDRGRIAICDRARAILNWEPRTDLKPGLHKTYDWISAQMGSSILQPDKTIY